jgi:hypothetical protein
MRKKFGIKSEKPTFGTTSDTRLFSGEKRTSHFKRVKSVHDVKHIGNFSSYANCEKSAASYTTPVKPPSPDGQPINPAITMICVQANEAGINSP